MSSKERVASISEVGKYSFPWIWRHQVPPIVSKHLSDNSASQSREMEKKVFFNADLTTSDKHTNWQSRHHQRLTMEVSYGAEQNGGLGRDIAQAVSRLLPTAAARVRAQVRSCVICGGQSGTRAGFLRVLWFPLPILILSTAP
jgi:hypothetical protein